MAPKKKDNKGKKEAKTKKPRDLYKRYEIKGDTITRKNPFSPKSPGDFMAVHKGRTVCGKTGYTEFQSKKETQAEE